MHFRHLMTYKNLTLIYLLKLSFIGVADIWGHLKSI